MTRQIEYASRGWQHATTMDTGALTEAIREHRVVELTYRGDLGGEPRTVHPHAIYRTTNGGLCVDALQVAGETRSGGLPSWKQFHLMMLVDVRVLDAGFETADDFDPASPKYRLGLLASAA